MAIKIKKKQKIYPEFETYCGIGFIFLKQEKILSLFFRMPSVSELKSIKVTHFIDGKNITEIANNKIKSRLKKFLLKKELKQLHPKNRGEHGFLGGLYLYLVSIDNDGENMLDGCNLNSSYERFEGMEFLRINISLSSEYFNYLSKLENDDFYNMVIFDQHGYEKDWQEYSYCDLRNLYKIHGKKSVQSLLDIRYG